jgi:glycosyltransferase involved in cell wall biosynthesis
MGQVSAKVENPRVTPYQTPTLTIAIPTFNRAPWLELNLLRLAEDYPQLPLGALEVVVSDNHSTDSTPQVVEAALAAGLPIRYIRNTCDLGSDANIAQCFNEARGHYVQIMGDDDLYVRGKLSRVVECLQSGEYGVVCLRPYGYEHDSKTELPGGGGKTIEYPDVGDFLGAIGPFITFISACVINREIQSEIDARKFCGSNLVQVHLVLHAMLRVQPNLFLTDYILACRRNASGGYDFSEVFVERLGRIMDGYVSEGLRTLYIRKFEARMLTSYHPYYLFRQRLEQRVGVQATYQRFATRFGERPLFRYWAAPILWLPRPLALLWGGLATVIGRAANGDLRRGLYFLLNKVRRP